jgi:class 3 adenylate cyclase
MDGFDPRSRFGTRRRLVAILAADVAGYSRLIGEDESGTLALMAERREEMDALIDSHSGRIANTAGDSVLAEFGSVVEAVACAIAIQRRHAEAQPATAEPRQVRFRIGVHIGDILIRDGDLFGDGVNIAARVEATAEPGGIALSGKVRDEIRGRFDVALRNGGAVALKNIRKPVHVWHIAPGAPLGIDTSDADEPAAASRPKWHRPAWLSAGTAAAALALIAGLTLRPGDDLPTYTVQPFTVAGDIDIARPLASALSAHIASGVGAIPYLRLLQPDHPGQTVPARYTIAGTVAVTGTATHVDTRIIETATGKVLSNTAFNPPSREAGEMVQDILGTVGDNLSVAINQLRYPVPPDTADTRRARQLAQEARNVGGDTRIDPDRALRLFEDASRLSPADLDIVGWHANSLIAFAVAAKTPPERTRALLDQARAMIAAQGEAVRFHRILGYARCQLANYDGEASEAVGRCDENRSVSPWSARVYKEIGTAYMKMGQLGRALQSFAHADQLNRRLAIRWMWTRKAGIAAVIAGENKPAAEWLRATLSARRDDVTMHGLLALVYRRSGDPLAMEHQIASMLRIADAGAAFGQIEDDLAALRFADPAASTALAGVRREVAALRDVAMQ